MTREQHSADWLRYIMRTPGGKRWLVYFDGYMLPSVRTREQARQLIRILKVATK